MVVVVVLVVEVVVAAEGGRGRQKDGVGLGWGGGRGESVEPAGLNSTAEPVTPTIHQCRGVTRQGQGYVTGGGRAGDGGGLN